MDDIKNNPIKYVKLFALLYWLFFMICVNTENGIKYRMVIGRESRGSAYRP